MLGFSEKYWDATDYGMEQRETTDTRHTADDLNSTAVFLRMKIRSTPTDICSSIQPKGEAWLWLPQRFIDYHSCHTHYTKRYMFYGLLIRSLTICNHMSDFQNVVIHYAQGLIARGFPAAPLRKSWHRFLQAKVPAHERPPLNTFFHTWLRSQTFAPTALDDNAVAAAR